jgi:phage shock protein E
VSSPTRFQKLVQEAKSAITEISPAETAEALRRGTLIIDVREKEDWDNEHIPGAVHLSRGVVELEIEDLAPELSTPIICHCGGGSRSALVAESLQRMGYTNVKSMAGGFRAWKQEGLSTTAAAQG